MWTEVAGRGGSVYSGGIYCSFFFFLERYRVRDDDTCPTDYSLVRQQFVRRLQHRGAVLKRFGSFHGKRQKGERVNRRQVLYALRGPPEFRLYFDRTRRRLGDSLRLSECRFLPRQPDPADSGISHPVAPAHTNNNSVNYILIIT